MVHLPSASLVSLTLVALSHARPLVHKRIAQVITDATADWEKACLAAGGAQECNPISVNAFGTLLAAPDACEQQNAADAMIDLAHKLNNDAEMIRLAQLFRQQPRNAPDSTSSLYCQKAPKNAELDGLFQCQFAGTKPDVFTGGVQVGAPGTIPLGLNAPVNPPGACPASPEPIPDGQQLNKIASSTGAGQAVDTAPPPANRESSVDASPVATAAPAPTGVVPTAPAPAADAKPFTLSNGQDAQALNAKFATLTADSPCTDGDQACVNGGFAQCVGGKFVIQGCAGGLQCFALPLVNAKGTSITCSTEADADARIAATGAQGGFKGTGAAASAPAVPVVAPTPNNTQDNKPAATQAPAPAANAGAKPFTLDNGKDAQQLNKQFAGLNAGSSCQAGENACVDGGFAQCVGGKFVVTGCAGGLTCAAVPLVNSRGTSIVCTTQDDALARIAASGATGGLTGQ